MMKKFYLTIIVASIIMLYPVTTFSQRIGVLPLNDNGSFAGSAKHSRLIASATYSQYDNGFSSGNRLGFYSSYDKFIQSISSGIGFSVSQNFGFINLNDSLNYDYIGTGVYGTIAPKFSLKGKYTFSPSFSLGYQNSSDTYIGNFNTDGFSGQIGFTINSPTSYIGIKTRLFESKELKDDRFDYFSTTVQFGHAFQFTKNSRLTILPQLAFNINGKNESNVKHINSFTYNLGFKYDNYYLALFNQTFGYIPGIQIGWQKNGLKFMLSNEYIDHYRATFTLRYLFHQNDQAAVPPLY